MHPSSYSYSYPSSIISSVEGHSTIIHSTSNNTLDNQAAGSSQIFEELISKDFMESLGFDTSGLDLNGNIKKILSTAPEFDPDLLDSLFAFINFPDPSGSFENGHSEPNPELSMTTYPTVGGSQTSHDTPPAHAVACPSATPSAYASNARVRNGTTGNGTSLYTTTGKAKTALATKSHRHSPYQSSRRRLAPRMHVEERTRGENSIYNDMHGMDMQRTQDNPPYFRPSTGEPEEQQNLIFQQPNNDDNSSGINTVERVNQGGSHATAVRSFSSVGTSSQNLQNCDDATESRSRDPRKGSSRTPKGRNRDQVKRDQRSTRSMDPLPVSGDGNGDAPIPGEVKKKGKQGKRYDRLLFHNQAPKPQENVGHGEYLQQRALTDQILTLDHRKHPIDDASAIVQSKETRFKVQVGHAMSRIQLVLCEDIQFSKIYSRWGNRPEPAKIAEKFIIMNQSEQNRS
ncbi:hypothetical protein JR316_0009359 [Psilocybe cubensis]|uniref:Uncharacterized protein n=2 Tax=Psilocybe cubensis TaxID=181762 RepID=A0A8H8CK79_PSICU|nr:hypothetical protein JR316_0009359 [Psilocybe cubensis]KAH9478897.1 hypothetical protein JR316_0009359 [Psilocybe cubensis]